MMRNGKQRILIVDLSKRYGGVDVRVADMAIGLKDQCEILVVVLKDSPIAKILQQAGVAIHSVQRDRHDPRIALDIARVARAFRPDVIDSHNPQSQLWGAIAGKLAGIETSIATVHSIYRIAHRGLFRQRAHEAVLRLCRMMGLRFIAVSKSIRNYLIWLGAAPHRVTLSYNGVPALPSDIQAVDLRKTLGISGSHLLVGMIGRVQKVKGYDVLIAAIAKLKEKGCVVHAIVIGEGTDEGDLRRLINEANLTSQVHCLGHRKDITSIMAEMDVLCMPSRSEGFPYTALEAARSGLPMVASKIDGLQEVFIDHETALLVPPDNADALADALETMAHDIELRSRLGQAARNLIVTRFTIQKMLSETLAVYDLGK